MIVSGPSNASYTAHYWVLQGALAKHPILQQALKPGFPCSSYIFFIYTQTDLVQQLRQFSGGFMNPQTVHIR